MSRESRTARDEKFAAWLVENRVVVYTVAGLLMLMAFVVNVAMRVYAVEAATLRLSMYFLGGAGIAAIVTTHNAKQQLSERWESHDSDTQDGG